MKSNIPQDIFTPYGYIDNPYHTWRLHRSGVLRTSPPVGISWHFPNVSNQIYVCFFNLGILKTGQAFLTQEDFCAAKVNVVSPYHTKNILAYEYTIQCFHFRIDFLLEAENILSCVCRVRNLSGEVKELALVGTIALQVKLGQSHLGEFGTAVSHDPDLNALIVRTFAEGPLFVLKGSIAASGCALCASTKTLADLASQCASGSLLESAICSRDFVRGYLTFPISIDHGQIRRVHFRLARGFSKRSVQRELKLNFSQVASTLIMRRRTDERFWSQCPQLVGNWPGHWRRGWVYDWETLRMCMRSPAGIFRTKWDAMQIQKPRVVLAETALDMLMMSYADDQLAKEVLLGTFSDALGPQIPCSREDGSMNMVAADGSECGTSPAWCFPFYCIESIYLRSGDNSWLASLLPFMEDYLLWWLKHRSDPEGWGIYKCSWESGQDCSEKFCIDQPTGGELVEHLRAVDLQAGIYGSANTLIHMLKLLGHPTRKWELIQRKFASKVAVMWQEDWFCDFDRRTNEWVRPNGYYDITNLAPLLFGLASDAQISRLTPRIHWYLDNPQYWLEWASFFFMFAELLWAIGQRELLSRTIYETAERVYRMWDQREWEQGTAMPGVSVECWGLNKAVGAEGYGWAATLPLHIIRGLLGYRETWDCQDGFVLTPCMPKRFLTKKGDKFGIRNLKYRDIDLELSYRTQGSEGLLVSLKAFSPSIKSLSVLRANTSELIANSHLKNGAHILMFEARNFECYHLKIRIV